MVKKQKLINSLSVCCYAFMLAFALVVLLICAISLANMPQENENLGEGIAKVLLILLIIFSSIQVLVSIIPFVLKIVFIKKQKVALPIISMFFDVAFAVFYFLLIFGAFEGVEVETISFIISLVGVLVAIASGVFNILGIIFCKRKKEKTL